MSSVVEPLINLADIREFWPASLNLDSDRIVPHIVRAQENNLQSIMSPPLYTAFMKAFIQDFSNPLFEGLSSWLQVGPGTAWVPVGARGVQVTMANGTSTILHQQIYTRGLPFTMRIVMSTNSTINTFNILVANKSDFSDATIALTAPTYTGDQSFSLTSLVPVFYVGVRLNDIITGPPSIMNIYRMHIMMAPRWYDLFHGQEYTYGNNYPQVFPGVRPLLCAYAYDNILTNNQLHVTRGGVNKKIGEQSENATDKNVSVKSSEAYSEAIRLEGQFAQWASQKNYLYPEYTSGRAANIAQPMFYNASRNNQSIDIANRHNCYDWWYRRY